MRTAGRIHVEALVAKVLVPARPARLAVRLYRLLSAGWTVRESPLPGTLGGNRRLKIYGRLDCPSAIRALPKGYARRRVFFLDEPAALAAGYRPCGRCLRERYRVWKAGAAKRRR